jgi:opacity protein-like surface antigen
MTFGFTRGFTLALALAALAMGGRSAHAQAAPVPYMNSSWLMGLGDTPAFDANDPQSKLPKGWFMSSSSSSAAWSTNRFDQTRAFGNFGSLSSDGVKFGYNFANSPVTVFTGFDTLKYNYGSGAPPLTPFDSTSSTLPGGYRASAGVEFRPTSNLSLSFGASFTQQQSPGLVDSDIHSTLPPGASPLAFGRR